MTPNETNRYLVTFANPPVSPMRAGAVLNIAEAAAAESLLHFPDLGVSVVTLSAADAETLRRHESVLVVEEDTDVHILGFPDDPGPEAEAHDTTTSYRWNITMVEAPGAWARGYQGQDISVAVLDTGIAAHPDLVISGGVSVIPGVTSYNDGNGHGTHCAGIIGGRGVNNVYGVAPQCNLYAVKVLSDSGSGSASWILSGMQWCIDNQMRIASMSLGGVSAPSIAYAQAVQSCQKNGVLVVCAAGNSYRTTFPWVNSPANSAEPRMQNESPTAVAAIDQNRLIASFSSRGGRTTPWNQVTLSAPGVHIYSTYLNDGYKYLSGTSMACPHVSGLAALVCESEPGISPHLVNAKIASTATNLGASPFPNETFGYGLIDCAVATR